MRGVGGHILFFQGRRKQMLESNSSGNQPWFLNHDKRENVKPTWKQYAPVTMDTGQDTRI